MKILDDQFVKNLRVLFRSVISRLIYYISWNKKIRRKEYWANYFWSIARCKDAGLSLWHLLWIFGGSIFGAIIIGILESEKSK